MKKKKKKTSQHTKVFCARGNKMVLFFVLSFTLFERVETTEKFQKKNLCTWKNAIIGRK